MATLPGSRTGMARLAQFFFFPLAKEESKPTTVFCFFLLWLTVQFWAVGVDGGGEHWICRGPLKGREAAL